MGNEQPYMGFLTLTTTRESSLCFTQGLIRERANWYHRNILRGDTSRFQEWERRTSRLLACNLVNQGFLFKMPPSKIRFFRRRLSHLCRESETESRRSPRSVL